MAAGENPGALVAGMHSHLAPQAVADWQAVLTAVQRLDQVGVGPVGYCGMSMGCGLGSRSSPQNPGSARQCWACSACVGWPRTPG